MIDMPERPKLDAILPEDARMQVHAAVLTIPADARVDGLTAKLNDVAFDPLAVFWQGKAHVRKLDGSAFAEGDFVELRGTTGAGEPFYTAVRMP